jgi:O-antigen/teichoic acid export membrane protein
MWKNILLISSGTFIAQILGILLTPLITRVYLPQDYGVLTSFNSIISILVIICLFDYHKAIPIANNDKQVTNLIFLSLSILLSFTFFLFTIFYFFGENLLGLLNLNGLFNYRYFIPIGVFSMGIYNIFLEFELRNRSYSIISRATIIQSSIHNSLRILFGYFNLGAIGLISSTIIGRSFGFYSLYKLFPFRNNFLNSFNLKNYKNTLIQFKRYPLYSIPSNLLYTISNELPLLFFTATFGNNTVGLLALAYNIIRIPSNLIGMSISQVFFAEAAKIGKKDPIQLKNLSKNIIIKLSLIGMIPLIIIVLFGPNIFSFLFGEQWMHAGIYARFLSVMIYCHFLTQPVGRLLDILELQKIGLLFNLIRLFILIFSLYISYKLNFTSDKIVIIYAFINSIFYCSLLYLIFKILNNNCDKFDKSIVY